MQQLAGILEEIAAGTILPSKIVKGARFKFYHSGIKEIVSIVITSIDPNGVFYEFTDRGNEGPYSLGKNPEQAADFLNRNKGEFGE